jgi:methylglutaconyl-CoA hydratase
VSDAAGPLRVLREGAVARLVLDRPDKRNALNAELVAALKAALRGADADEGVRVVAIEGAGKDFCSGADLSALRRIAGAGAMENLEDVDELAELFALPRRMRKPVVALVRGRALAGGCGLATACDLVLAAESAQLGYPEVRIGFVPAMVMAILRRNVSEKRAFELIVRGRPISAAEAERIGLVNHVFGDDAFDAEANAVLEDLAAQSASAVQLSKRLLYNSDGMGFDAAIRAGADVNVVARMTDDMKAGVARFLERDTGAKG